MGETGPQPIGTTTAEPAEGESLRDLLARVGRLPWEPAAYVVLGLARALAQASAHRPARVGGHLRPERVRLQRDGTPILGAGAAAEAAPPAAAATLDELRYSSPELIDARPVDERSDLYGLGLLLYELLAGHPPYQSSSTRTLVNMQCSEPPPPLAPHVRTALPPGLHKLLHELLEKDPERRPGSAAAVVERLEAFVSDGARQAWAQLVSGGGPSAPEATAPAPLLAATAPPVPAPVQAAAAESRQEPAASAATGKDEPVAPKLAADKTGADGGPASSQSKPDPWADGGSEAAEQTPAAAAAGAGRQLSVVQLLLLVLAFTLVAGTIAYCTRAGGASPAAPSDRAPYLDPPSRPLGTVGP